MAKLIVEYRRWWKLKILQKISVHTIESIHKMFLRESSRAQYLKKQFTVEVRLDGIADGWVESHQKTGNVPKNDRPHWWVKALRVSLKLLLKSILWKHFSA